MSNTKFAMLWVYQTTTAMGHGRMVESGQKPSLCVKGRKHMMCVAAGHPVRILKRDAKDFDKYRRVMDGKDDYPVDKAVRRFNDIATRCGITEGAKKLLVLAESEAGEFEVDESQFENEETVDMPNEETAAPVAGEENSTTKETKVSKKKATKKAPAKTKAPAKAKAKTAKAKAPAKVKGDGLGREGTLSRFVNEMLVGGKDNETISAAAKKKFPKEASTDLARISWFRWNAKKKGILKS